MADIVLFGTGDMAKVAKVYIDRHGPDRIVGFTVDAAFFRGDTLEGLPVVPWEELEKTFPPGRVKLLGPMTYKRLNEVRRNRYLEGKSRGYEFSRFIHPATHIYTDKIGENCLILEGNIIQPFATIGNNVIIWSGNHIGHHVSVGDHCFIASQVGIAGSAQIGEGCYIAGQVGIIQGVRIGARSALLNAAFVSKDIPEESVSVGVDGEMKKYSSRRLKHLI